MASWNIFWPVNLSSLPTIDRQTKELLLDPVYIYGSTYQLQQSDYNPSGTPEKRISVKLHLCRRFKWP